MGLPGFHAETTLYKSNNAYTIAATLKWSDVMVRYGDKADIYINGPWFRICGGAGQPCCRAPEASQNIPEFGPLVSCEKGLGCDLKTSTCVAPCGGPGQPCCDGPETRAPKWTWDGRVYSPNSWNMIEMCQTGACEKQSHRCFTCGMTDGSPCCPPDAAQATARCRGPNLTCAFDPWGFYESGTCWACGIKGREPCDWGCAPGLGIRKGLCDTCGADFQPPCDKGCNPGLGLVKGLCRPCGNAGQIPCDSGCFGGLRVKNGLCAACGGNGQTPCDAGCNNGTTLIAGVCRYCGAYGQTPCPWGCYAPMKPAGGVCKYCGGNGQAPCDAGCNPGYTLSGGQCVPTGSPPPPGGGGETCATEGQNCVADFVAGTHCCKSGGPLLCVYGKCKACVPHGEECKLGGPQTCCSAKDGDVCVLDQFSEKVVCGIPG